MLKSLKTERDRRRTRKKLYTSIYEYKSMSMEAFERLYRTHKFKKDWVVYQYPTEDNEDIIVRRVKIWVAYTTI